MIAIKIILIIIQMFDFVSMDLQYDLYWPIVLCFCFFPFLDQYLNYFTPHSNLISFYKMNSLFYFDQSSYDLLLAPVKTRFYFNYYLQKFKINSCFINFVFSKCLA